MDDIISQYLKPKEGETSVSPVDKSVPTDRQDEDIIKQYLKPKGEKRLYVSPIKPPISPFDKETSDELNSRPSVTGGANPRAGIGSVAVKAGGAALEDLGSGLNQAKEGVTDIFSNRPATGFGKLGTGAMSVIAAPSDAASSVAADISGSKDIGDRFGLVAGVLPVGKAAKVAAGALPKNKAFDELVNQITSNGRDPQALVNTIQAMKSDSRIGPVDTSPAVLSNTQDLFTKEGDATKNYLFSASKNRVANLPEDVKGAFNDAGGVPVNVVQKLADLGAASKKVGNDLINPALEKAKPVDITNTLDSIDQVLKPGVWAKIDAQSSLPLSNVKKELTNIRSYLANKTEMRTNANDLHGFQSGLRTTAEKLLGSSSGAERSLGFELAKVRNSLVNDIDASAPGYKEALSKYRDEKNIAEAFRHAHDDVFSKSLKMENAPEITEKWFNNLSDHEKEAAREGARLAVRSRMGVADNTSLAGTNFARSEYNQEKLKLLFGKNETEKLLRDLENTRAIKNSDQKIIEGSQTAARSSGNEALKLPGEKEKSGSIWNYALPVAGEYAGQLMSGTPGIGAIIGGGAVAAKALGSKVYHEVATKMAKERNLHFAKMALPVEGPSRNQLIKELEARIPGPKQSLLSRVTNRLPISP